MGTYSELLMDENILRGVGDAKSIVILGCPNCANLSIAYSKNITPVGKSSLGGLIYKPYAITQEASRVKTLLENKGKSAKIKIFSRTTSPLCGMREKERRIVTETVKGKDAVITLCCTSGWHGVENAIPKSVKSIPGMKAVGIFYVHLNTEKGNEMLDKEKTKIMYFKAAES